jgi:phytoene desaturase
MKKAAVIGAGIAGIATAIHLANKGYQVEVFEANSYAGGKLSEFWKDGFRYDAGPSLFTFPERVEELILKSGKKVEDYFSYQKLDTINNYFWEDGTRLEASADIQVFAKQMEDKIGEPKENVLKFLKNSKEKYELTADLFLTRSLHKAETFFNRTALKAVSKIWKLELFKTMNQANSSLFEKEKTVQLFNRYATYNGSSPYSAPALLNIIPHVEYNKGAFLPTGGMFDITSSLVQLGQDLGVKYHFNTKVEEILLENNKIKGIKVKDSKTSTTSSENLDFDVVVSDMDIVHTYKKLLPNEKAPEFLLQQQKSLSALIFYWGMNAEYKNLDLHNVFFTKDYKKEFNALFNGKTLYEDPTVYIYISSKYVETDAPKGNENWFVMINAPHNLKDGSQDWDELIKKAKQDIIKKLERVLMRNVEENIISEAILDPRKIELRTSSLGGSLYGNSSNNRYAAFLRHANFSKTKGLYFCGGSVHPGGGIPLALSSAKIVGEMIEEA